LLAGYLYHQKKRRQKVKIYRPDKKKKDSCLKFGEGHLEGHRYKSRLGVSGKSIKSQKSNKN